ncbi:cytochrome B [Mariprofundus sp. EBB-1]|uniref:cytochrome b/b6 domain-containing protein n=1 Tax=Mariprofundus sp. EBB-1 TaxID=2650971 RepID=UPI000EF25AD7|nr:cytochrome b/b6 domain-containing protein [Mariprofundus sp. EBB-1]RLL53685.1 cytochrome B [Mariprofundus sp. EBB-1]
MNNTKQILIWDPLLRIFHALLAVCFLAAYYVEDDMLKLHVLLGSIVFGLIIFRLFWGIFGTEHARFSDFIYSITQIKNHLLSLVFWKPSHHSGHTPAGGVMIFFLLAGLLILTISGIMLYGLENDVIPFAHRMADMNLDSIIFIEQLHSLIADTLILAVLLHIAGVLVESILQQQNLMKAMITGYKKVRSQHHER